MIILDLLILVLLVVLLVRASRIADRVASLDERLGRLAWGPLASAAPEASAQSPAARIELPDREPASAEAGQAAAAAALAARWPVAPPPAEPEPAAPTAEPPPVEPPAAEGPPIAAMAAGPALIPETAPPAAEPLPPAFEPERATEPVLPPFPAYAMDAGAPEAAAGGAVDEPPGGTEPPPSVPPAPQYPDFELSFGRRWAVLIGGGAVVLGSILLVRHSIVQGYFPPGARLIAAALFSLLLMGGAEVLRRRGTFAGIASLPKALPDIPSTLFGAGAAGLFATIFAAHAVYGFIGAGAAFLLMGAVALSGVAASLHYGPPLAVFGYLAAQSVPFLVGGRAGLTTAGYIAGVGLATYAVAWRRGWRWLEVVVAAVLSAWVLVLRLGDPRDAAVVAVAAAAGGFASVLRLRPREALAVDRPADLATTVALALIALNGLAIALPVPVVYRPGHVVTGIVLLVAVLAASVLVPAGRRIAPIAALVLIGVFANLLGSVPSSEGYAMSSVPIIGLTFGHVLHLFGWVTAASLVLGATAVRRMTRISPATALFGTVSVVGLLIGGDLVLRAFGEFDRRLLAAFALVQGAGLLAAAWPRGGRIPAEREFASVLAATGGLALIALVPVILLTGPTLTVALSLLVLAAAALAVYWRAPALVPVAAAACLAMLAYSGIDGVRTFLRWRHLAGTDLLPLLVNTALPGLVVVLALLLLRKRMPRADFEAGEALWRSWLGLAKEGEAPRPPLSTVVMTASAGALLLAALVITIRWLVFRDAYAPLQAPTDLGVFSALALSGAFTTLRLYRATGIAALVRVLTGLACAGAVALGLALIANPFVATPAVGRLPIFNLLALAYLVPALIGFALATSLRRNPLPAEIENAEVPRVLAGAVAVAGSFAFVTFSVTQAFQGRTLRVAAITESELWAYTLVWLLYGIALLLFGLRTQVRWVRVTAFAVMIGVILKAFLIDMSHLTGVARALSFIALGLVLLGVGMFYQRVMGRQEPRESAG